MRIFWPTGARSPPSEGIAIGWRDGDVLLIAAIVPAWRDEYELISSDRLSVLADVRSLDLQYGPEDSSLAPRLTVFCQNGAPAALSTPGDIVLYTPASSVADLLIYKDDSEGKKENETPDDDVLAMVVRSTNVQRFIFPDTIPKRRSWDILEALHFLVALNFVKTYYREFSEISRPTASSSNTNTKAFRLPRLTWRTSENWKAATRMPLPRLRRHGFGYRSDLARNGGAVKWSEVTLQQVMPIIFVLLFICRRYWLPLIWQALLAIVVVGAWVVYEVGMNVLGRLIRVWDRFHLPNMVLGRLWHFVIEAHEWSASVNALAFIWTMTIGLSEMREDSLTYKRNSIRLHVERFAGPLIGILFLPALQSFKWAPICVDPVIAAIDWLNSWPVGFKLNTELSDFMSSTLKLGLSAWKDVILPYIPAFYTHVSIIWSIHYSIVCLSHALDAFRLMTLHLRAGYLFTRTLYRWQMSALGGLWNLFRGKRWNTLRHRTDSHVYDLDTLFLGTLLFTLSVFLAPTLVAYYGVFFIVNAVLTAVEGCLRLGIVCAKTCPWYELQLRARFPDALPGGVVFEPVALPELERGDVVPIRSMLRVHVVNKSYGEILKPMLGHLRDELGSLKARF